MQIWNPTPCNGASTFKQTQTLFEHFWELDLAYSEHCQLRHTRCVIFWDKLRFSAIVWDANPLNFGFFCTRDIQSIHTIKWTDTDSTTVLHPSEMEFFCWFICLFYFVVLLCFCCCIVCIVCVLAIMCLFVWFIVLVGIRASLKWNVQAITMPSLGGWVRLSL